MSSLERRHFGVKLTGVVIRADCVECSVNNCFTQGVAIAGTTIAVGSVVTAIRTGMLALGFLSQLPAWTFFDPLMVVDGVSGDEGDSLEDIVDRQARETNQTDTRRQN